MINPPNRLIESMAAIDLRLLCAMNLLAASQAMNNVEVMLVEAGIGGGFEPSEPKKLIYKQAMSSNDAED